jgi:putative acetyltransferase
MCRVRLPRIGGPSVQQHLINVMIGNSRSPRFSVVDQFEFVTLLWDGRKKRTMLRIVQGDFSDPRVIDLLHIHLTSARTETAAGSAHALDITGLQSPDISFWTIWDDEALLGFGALKVLSADHGEVKSMHTTQAMRGKGIGSAVLRHIIETARANGMSRLSLETGAWEYFRPARALYRSHGFVECPPFADYVLDPNSVFMSLDLRKA